MVRVHRSTAQTITTATETALSCDATDFDRLDMHDASGNPTRLTCVVPGIYLIGGHVAWSGTASGTYRKVSLRKSGPAYLAADVRNHAAWTGQVAQEVITMYRLLVGDFVELVVEHDRGSDLDTTQQNSFWAVWKGGL